MRTAHVIHDRSDSHNVRSAVLPELLLQLLAGRRAASRQLLRENSTVDVLLVGVGLPPGPIEAVQLSACNTEAEPILVLTRREGASFVLDLTCDRLALHAPAVPSSTCVITCVPCAVTCERLSKSVWSSSSLRSHACFV